MLHHTDTTCTWRPGNCPDPLFRTWAKEALFNMHIQKPEKLNLDAVLLRQIGEALYGAEWQTPLSQAVGVSDRSVRRWAAGTDEVPSGVWRDIHLHAYARWATIKYFDEEIERFLQSSVLHPIPNSEPKLAMLGLHFALHTAQGRPVRCFINREVFDDRVQRNPAAHVLNYFRDYADAFYRVAQRKFDSDEIENGVILISNADVAGENLPDVRPH
jgi:Protein of unknown function (DUF1488)